MICPDGLIFDLDGTLWDTAAICAEAWNQAIQKENLLSRKILARDISSVMGLTSEDVRRKLFPDLTPEISRKILKRCFENEVHHIRNHEAPLYAGVAEGISKLSRFHKLFIVSNCESEYLAAFLEKSNLSKCFLDWECHGNNRLSKGENIELIARRNSLNRPFYFGDTKGDEDASRSAGVAFAHVSYGFGSAAAPDLRFQTFPEITEHFGKLMCSIEELQSEHGHRVLQIYVQGIKTGHATFQRQAPSWEEWDRCHLPNLRCVALVADRVVGWIALSTVSSRCVYAGVAEVSIYVDEEHRGQAIGQQLLKKMIELSEQAGIWTLQAGIFPENESSVRLHEKNGFRIVGRREKLGQLNGKWRDVMLLERRSLAIG